MILLPPHPQRASLLSFGLAVGITGVVLLGSLAWFYRTQFLWGAVAVAILVVPGVIWPELLVWPYRGWNKGARNYLRLAEYSVLRICFFTVIVPASWAGSCVMLDRPPSRKSSWLPRRSWLQTDHESNKHDGSGAKRGHWISRYIIWTIGWNQMWRLALLPFLLLLSWLKWEEESALPENIYTLF